VFIAKELNRESTCIQRYLKNEGYNPRGNVLNVTTEEQKTICNLYLQEIATEKIAEMFYPRIKSGKTIASILKDNGIEIRKRGVVTMIAHEDFFEVIDTEEKAYLLGLIVADGCIVETDNKSDTITITLHRKDRYLLEKMQEIIGIGRKILDSRNESILSTSSNKMSSDLSKYGIIPRKSDKTYLPQIRDDLMVHLIRGIFDGDGTVYSQGKRLIFGFYGSEEIAKNIRDYLVDKIGITKTSVFNKGTVSFVYFGNQKDVRNFYYYLYKDATIYLTRKKEKFESLFHVNTEVTTR
jgi:hypothetical protein